MNIEKTTLLTNIYNEEYLLPFWLNHHKDMFDDIIIIDYGSTDRSLEICKEICPNCKIIKSRNKDFGAEGIDAEFTDLEKEIKGVKTVLNTTEFLFTKKPIKDIFKDLYEKEPNKKSFSLDCWIHTPYSTKEYNIDNYNDLMKNLLNDDIKYHKDKWTRQLHNFEHGNYTIGRHSTRNIRTETNDAFIIWFGFYPLNEKLLKRKLQVKNNIPESDRKKGYSYHHFWTEEYILNLNKEKSMSGKSLKELNNNVYEELNRLFNK